MEELVHRWHNRFPHHRRVEAEHDAGMLVKLDQHLSVAGSPKILIFLELIVASLAAVFLVSAEKEATAEIEQH